MKSSWRTSLAGVGAAVVAAGGILTLLSEGDGGIDWNSMGPLIAALVSGIINAIGNLAARDNVVSSQDVGVRPTPTLVADAIARSERQ